MRAALFDLDGTLLDSLGVWADIDRAFLNARGHAVPPDYTSSIRGLSFQQTAEYTKQRFGLTESVEEIMEIWHFMCERAYVGEVRLKSGAEAYLKKLKQAGVLLGVVTTLTPRLYEPALKRNGVLDLFDTFATTDETGQDKQSGKVYQLAAQRLGLESPQCTVYEDLRQGLAGAKKCGMRTVLVYDPHNADTFEQSRLLADEIIMDYRECI